MSNITCTLPNCPVCEYPPHPEARYSQPRTSGLRTLLAAIDEGKTIASFGTPDERAALDVARADLEREGAPRRRRRSA